MKIKKKTFKELEAGDWFVVDYIDSKLIVFSIDYEDGIMMVTSPCYLANTYIRWELKGDDTFNVIGTSKRNIWYKLFFNCSLICPWKRVDLV